MVLVGLVFIIVAVWWATQFILYRESHVSSDDARVAADVISIASRSPGWVTHFDLMGADHVHKGEVLAVIYRKPTRFKLAEQIDKSRSLQARIDTLQQQKNRISATTSASLKDAQATLQAARYKLNALKARQKLAKSNVNRGHSELAKAFISRQKYEQLKTSERVAHQNVLSGKAVVHEDEAQYHKRLADKKRVLIIKKQIKQYRSELDALQQDIASTKNTLKDLTLHSPVNGVIDKTFIHQGDYVSTGETLLLVHDPNHVWVKAKIKETKVASLQVGDPVDITLAAYPGRTFHGSVKRIGTAATNQFALLPNPNPSGNFIKTTQRVPVRIAVKQTKNDLLKPGLNASVAIQVNGKN